MPPFLAIWWETAGKLFVNLDAREHECAMPAMQAFLFLKRFKMLRCTRAGSKSGL